MNLDEDYASWFLYSKEINQVDIPVCQRYHLAVVFSVIIRPWKKKNVNAIIVVKSITAKIKSFAKNAKISHENQAHPHSSSMTKYKPVNDNVIIQKVVEQAMSSSGFITGDEQNYYLVVGAQEKHSDLLNQKIFINKEPVHLGEDMYCVATDAIVAYME